MEYRKILRIYEIGVSRVTFYTLFIATFIFQTSCKKLVEVDPPITGLVSSTVFANNATAAAVITSIYSKMSNAGVSTGYGGLSLRLGLISDELDNYNTNDPELSGIYSNSLSNVNNYFWTELYQLIYISNSAIEGLNGSTILNPGLKQQLIGEAKFMRAFLHFYAVNLYGDVPIITSTDYRVNNVISRMPKEEVYNQIIEDLKDAQNKLSDDYFTPQNNVTTERVRPNKGAATALLARVYLYIHEWEKAEMQSALVINNNSEYNLMSNLNEVFLMNSGEAIWQLQPVDPTRNTIDAALFVLTSPPGSNTEFPVALSSYLKNVFESGDNRLNNWVGKFDFDTTTYYFPFKYKVYLENQPVTEYLMVLRLAEQYLIRAEARAETGNLLGAQEDLNTIRTRAGLLNSEANDKASILSAILHERQVELFTEWGHRWLDLIRTNNVNTVMNMVTPKKGGTWNIDWILFPIPLTETLINPNLTQNPGYN